MVKGIVLLNTYTSDNGYNYQRLNMSQNNVDSDGDEHIYNTQVVDEIDEDIFSFIKKSYGSYDKIRFEQELLQHGEEHDLEKIRYSLYDYMKANSDEPPTGCLSKRVERGNKTISEKYASDIYLLYGYLEGFIPVQQIQSEVMSKRRVSRLNSTVNETLIGSTTTSYENHETNTTIMQNIIEIKQMIKEGNDCIETNFTRLVNDLKAENKTLKQSLSEQNQDIAKLKSEIDLLREREASLRSTNKILQQETKIAKDESYINQITINKTLGVLRQNQLNIDKKLSQVLQKTVNHQTYASAVQSHTRSLNTENGNTHTYSVLTPQTKRSNIENNHTTNNHQSESSPLAMNSDNASFHTVDRISISEEPDYEPELPNSQYTPTPKDKNIKSYSHLSLDTISQTSLTTDYDMEKREKIHTEATTQIAIHNKGNDKHDFEQSQVQNDKTTLKNDISDIFCGFRRKRTKKIVLYNVKASGDIREITPALKEYAKVKGVHVTYVKVLKKNETRFGSYFTLKLNINHGDYEKLENTHSFWPSEIYWRDWAPRFTNDRTTDYYQHEQEDYHPPSDRY